MAKRKKKEDNTLLLVILGVITLLGILTLPKLFLFLLLVIAGVWGFLFLKKVQEFKIINCSNIKEIDVMNGTQFENYLAVLFKSMGYKTKITPTSRDYGADLIVMKDNRKIVIQAKRYSNKVGISSVQQIVGAKNYYKADEIWVITNNYFTQPAINLAYANNVILIDRDSLIQLSTQVN